MRDDAHIILTLSLEHFFQWQLFDRMAGRRETKFMAARSPDLKLLDLHSWVTLKCVHSLRHLKTQSNYSGRNEKEVCYFNTSELV